MRPGAVTALAQRVVHGPAARGGMEAVAWPTDLSCVHATSREGEKNTDILVNIYILKDMFIFPNLIVSFPSPIKLEKGSFPQSKLPYLSYVFGEGNCIGSKSADVCC